MDGAVVDIVERLDTRLEGPEEKSVASKQEVAGFNICLPVDRRANTIRRLGGLPRCRRSRSHRVGGG